MERAHYKPPWADPAIIGVAGSSGSGKTSLAVEIVSSLNLPWVVILSMDSFYKALDPADNAKAHANEYDFDSPEAIDFTCLFECLEDIKAGRRAHIPRYSFERHQREETTLSIYSPHVLILEGIFALYDQRILNLLDMKIFAEADADVCLARRIVRDVQERGRDIEGCIKQWLKFVKPNFQKFVEPQRDVADIIVPHGMKNRVAIDMVVGQIRSTLKSKSLEHQASLRDLGQQVISSEEPTPLPPGLHLLTQTNQIKGICTILQDPTTREVDFIFYFDRLAALLVERALEHMRFESWRVRTPKVGECYDGLKPRGEVSAVVILRGGSCMEVGLKRVIPDCRTGRMLIQSSYRTGEPELHYCRLPDNIREHEEVLLLDPQMSSGGAALMAVRVLVDHGVKEENIVFVTMFVGKMGVTRLLKVFPDVKALAVDIGDDGVERWVEKRYFGT